MKHIGLALLLASGLGLAAVSAASAAPASGAPIAQAAGALGNVEQVWYDRFGRWHPNRRVLRAPSFYVGPPVIAPVCRSVRVCGRWGRCWWQRRCY